MRHMVPLSLVREGRDTTRTKGLVHSNRCLKKDLRYYSIPPKTGLSGSIEWLIRTQFLSGFRIASLERFIVKKIFYSCQNGLG